MTWWPLNCPGRRSISSLRSISLASFSGPAQTGRQLLLLGAVEWWKCDHDLGYRSAWRRALWLAVVRHVSFTLQLRKVFSIASSILRRYAYSRQRWQAGFAFGAYSNPRSIDGKNRPMVYYQHVDHPASSAQATSVTFHQVSRWSGYAIIVVQGFRPLVGGRIFYGLSCCGVQGNASYT